jgi:hypothetical protein
MGTDDDDRFDDDDLMELICLAVYLEGKAERGLFPKAKYWRYSDALDRLLVFLKDEISDMEIANEAAGYLECLMGGERSPSPSAKILTHPRFRGRKKRPGK